MNTAGKATIAILGIAALTGVSYGVSEYLRSSETRKFRDRLESMLRDPITAQYRHDEVVKSAGGGKAYCGLVNAKNSFGGYVGFRRFVVTGARVTIEPSSDGDSVESLQEQLDFLNFLRDNCFTAAEVAAAASNK